MLRTAGVIARLLSMESPKGNLPYRLIYELGNAFASRLELVPLIELVTSKCREVLDADGVAVMLLDAESQELYFPYFSDRDSKVAERLARARVPVGKGIAGEVFQTGRSVRIDNVSTDRHFYSGVDKKTGLTTRSVIAAPLVANEIRLGVIEAVNPLGREAFSDNDLALPRALADSGDFTGADRDQPGFFRAASGGIIFLDEIGEMPLAMQPTLLRVLQDGEIISVGDTRPEKVNVRVFSATNRDLKAAVAAGRFRADLYYRLSAFPIQLPPLRARRRDIPLLAARLLSIASERQPKEIRQFDSAALDLPSSAHWPANIRDVLNDRK